MGRRAGYLAFAAVMLITGSVSWGQKKAGNPSPPDGATDVTMPLLQWKAGSTAVFHAVYLGTTPDLGPADIVAPRLALNVAMYYHAPGIVPGTTYYWRVDETEKDLVTVIQGDVWHFTAWPTWAFLPDPVDGSNTAQVAPDLKWVAGQGAQKHHVYFSDNKAAVADGTAAADKGTVNEPNYAPGELSPGGTYFWRVDEVDGFGAVVAGSVWTFCTVLPVDDFESYTNEVGTRIFQTWVDGWGYTEPAPGNPGNGSGASVGHDIWVAGTGYTTIAETTVIHGGSQAMPLDYNNINTPYYAETDRTWAESQDWTANGVDTLTLHVRGQDRPFEILKAATPPTLDGTMEEAWATASVQYVGEVVDGASDGPQDCSGSFRAMYDSAYLYVLVDVTDEVLVQDSDAAQGWLDDRIEVFIDGNNSKDAAQDTTSDCQYCFRWNHGVVETPVEWYRSPGSLVGVKYGVVTTATGYCHEIQLPWSVMIGGAPRPGQLIGIDVMINDDDDGGDRDAQIAWYGGTAHVPSSWGTGLVDKAPVYAGDRLYVALRDASNRMGVVVYPDTEILKATTWTAWTIPLSDFANAGVNMAAVKKMFIGVGDRANPVPGGAGSLYFDDIYLTRPLPAGE